MYRLILLAGCIFLLPTPTFADLIPGYTVFGTQGVTMNGTTVTAGLTGSNGDVRAATVYGNVTAAGGVNLQFRTINGNILAGGNVSNASLSTVNGSITANGTITQSGTVNGTITPNAGATVNPVAYTPIQVPAADSFTAGGANVTTTTFQSQTLAPGSYGNVSLAGSSTLTLTAGNYYFTSLSTTGPYGFANLNYDLSNGPINIFVTGDINLLNSAEQNVYVNGVLQTNPLYGGLIEVESLGDINLNGFAYNSMYGTYFAPNGSITATTFTNVDGSLIAGGTITTGDDTITAVPEPRNFALCGLVLAGVIIYGRVGGLRRKDLMQPS